MIAAVLALGSMAMQSVYVGTYTGSEGSKGIYRVEFDPSSGQFSEPKLAAEVANPSYLARHGDRLFAVTEWGGAADLLEYQIAADGRLDPKHAQPAGGGGPCHIGIDPAGKFAAVSAYGGGTVNLFDLREQKVIWKFQNEGKGPNAQRQERPHMHFATFSADGKHLYACDLGTDEVLKFEVGSSTPKRFKIPAGGGPRHLAIHSGGKFVFVGNEMTSAVTTFRRDAAGDLTQLVTVSTLPEPFEGNSTAAVKLHPNGKWLYVSNRGHNSVAVFSIAKDGTLKLQQAKRLDLKTPRDFSLDASGKWILVAGQDSGDVVSYRVDPATGEVGAAVGRAKISRPVCVLVTT